MPSISKARRIKNSAAHGIFTVGGISVILVIIIMLAFLFKEIIPLFDSAGVTDKKVVFLNGHEEPLRGILSEDGRLSLFLYPSGELTLEESRTGKTLKTWTIEGAPAYTKYRENLLILSVEDSLYVYPLAFTRDPESGMETDARLGEVTRVEMPHLPVTATAVRQWNEEERTLAVASGTQLWFKCSITEETLFGEAEVRETTWSAEMEKDVAGLGFYPDGNLLVATKSGEIYIYNTAGKRVTGFQGPSPLSAFGQLIGGRGVCLGGADGTVEIWAQANTDEGKKFLRIHELEPMEHAVTGFTFSGRDRTFAAWDEMGEIRLYYSTAEETRLKIEGQKNLEYIFNPKGDLLLGYGEKKIYYGIHNPHPDVSFKTLFGKVWYEGYAAPAYVWQSTGGSNDFESKFSLIPLIVGTLKGTLYAMIFALPLALTGALFMNQFIHPNLQRYIKPVVEIMAGLPSVIIGFLAGLWLAPLLENVLPGVLLGFLVIPVATVIAALLLEKFLFRTGQDSYRWEIMFLLPFLVVTFWLCLEASPLIEDLLFRGDFRQYAFDVFGTPYDQRNAIVVGFAMGFAVIPIIFSLAEDAFSFVPQEVVAGSLALGLSRWKTATGVVMKAARSGVFSAAMIGLGRAVGETMIVLMATGNTPVMSLSPFNGFRTFSANIAVELPEAPVGGSPYRILFLTAFLLLLFTLIINTGADMVRQHMKKRLGQ